MEREAGLAPRWLKRIYIRYAEMRDRRRSDEIFRRVSRNPGRGSAWTEKSVVGSTKERATQPSLVIPTRLIGHDGQPSKNNYTSEMTLE